MQLNVTGPGAVFQDSSDTTRAVVPSSNSSASWKISLGGPNEPVNFA